MGKKGLIVDDAAFMRMMLREILTKGGYEVAGEAVNGKEAIEIYRNVSPDFVTMDITMPDMDGIEALREIKKIDANAVVIMCSAIGQQANVLEAIKTGARDFIVKPFQPERVLESIKKTVG
ncbi:MAG TPA: response regulator [bacterium]|nr:response regulator [bacterium]HQL62830.1 response regulator [bacterium]